MPHSRSAAFPFCPVPISPLPILPWNGGICERANLDDRAKMAMGQEGTGCKMGMGQNGRGRNGKGQNKHKLPWKNKTGLMLSDIYI